MLLVGWLLLLVFVVGWLLLLVVVVDWLIARFVDGQVC